MSLLGGNCTVRPKPKLGHAFLANTALTCPPPPTTSSTGQGLEWQFMALLAQQKLFQMLTATLWTNIICRQCSQL